jgi:hypothetical protein
MNDPFEVVVEPFPTAIKGERQQFGAIIIEVMPLAGVLLPEATASKRTARRAW